MIEKLNEISSDLKLRVFTFLIRDFTKNNKVRPYSINELKKLLNIKHNQLYKIKNDFNSLDIFVVQDKKRSISIQLNLDNELVKDLVFLEHLKQYGLSLGGILEKEIHAQSPIKEKL